MYSSSRNDILLTVTSLERHACCDAVYDEEAHNVTAIVLNETLKLLNFLLHWVSYVQLTLWLHIHIRSGDVQPENVEINII